MAARALARAAVDGGRVELRNALGIVIVLAMSLGVSLAIREFPSRGQPQQSGPQIPITREATRLFTFGINGAPVMRVSLAPAAPAGMCALFQTLSKARDQLPRHGTMRACFWPLTHRLTPAHYRSAISIRPLENFTLVYGGAPTSYAGVVRFGIKTGSRGCASVRSAAGFFVAAICERGRLSRWRYRYTLIGYSRRGVPLTRENLNALVVDLGTPARHDGQPQRW